MVENNKKMTGFSEPVTAMGCRSFVSKYEENGKEKYVGRFNLGVVSISLPYAAAVAKGKKDEFFKVLRAYLDNAFEMHHIRINNFKKTKAKSNPIIWMEGALARLGPEETVEKYVYGGNATASIGYMGVAEAQEICGDTSKEFGMEILKFLKDACEKEKEKTRISFSPYGSPGEVLCYRFATAIKRDFPELNFQHDYVTNSFHIPVRKQVDIFEKLEEESEFYIVSSGGNVNNVEVPNLANNLEAFESLVKAAHEKVNYLIVNQPVDQCFKCGFEGEFTASPEGFCCPSCGNKDDESISVIRRISGYIFSPNSRPANKGKQAEIIDRVKHVQLGVGK